MSSPRSPQPPLIFFACLLAGWGLGLLRPLETGLPPAFRYLACGLLWLWSGALGIWGLLTFRRLGTTHEPNGVPTALIETGPFLYSRNPLYVALCALLAGFGLLLDSVWPLALTPVLVVLLDRLVIAKEEQRLRAQFGDAYLSYQQRVGRWL
jgi:protein-S-isoprenylcysteine O-methyltransferase Ste14